MPSTTDARHTRLQAALRILKERDAVGGPDRREHPTRVRLGVRQRGRGVVPSGHRVSPSAIGEPTSSRSWSGASPSASTTSKDAVFCPSMRAGLTELTSSTG